MNRINKSNIDEVRYYLGLGYSADEITQLAGLSRSSVDRITSRIGITAKDVATYMKFKKASGLVANGVGLMEARKLAHISDHGFITWKNKPTTKIAEIANLIDSAVEKRAVDEIARRILHHQDLTLDTAYKQVCAEYKFDKELDGDLRVKIMNAIHNIGIPKIEAAPDRRKLLLAGKQTVEDFAVGLNINAGFVRKYLRDQTKPKKFL